jgi:hypothetical protein
MPIGVLSCVLYHNVPEDQLEKLFLILITAVIVRISINEINTYFLNHIRGSNGSIKMAVTCVVTPCCVLGGFIQI